MSKKNISGKNTADVSKARKELEKYSYFTWLDPFKRLWQTKPNRLLSEDNAGGEILEEDLTSYDGDCKAT